MALIWFYNSGFPNVFKISIGSTETLNFMGNLFKEFLLSSETFDIVMEK